MSSSPIAFRFAAKSADAPWRLALVTVFQFMERLPDRQAADAVRSRRDWKYALSLELTDPGCDHTVLSEFRSRLVASGRVWCARERQSGSWRSWWNSSTSGDG
jgi:transposase